MKGHLVMSSKELNRKSAFEWVKAGGGTLKEAAARLKVSYRQVKRSYKRWCAQGDRGLVHRSRGRPSNRGISRRIRRAIIRRCEERYLPLEMGPTLMAEKLPEDDFHVDHETLRRWLIQEGKWTKRRTRAQHRLWREPRACFGELVQLDGSHHRWFGPDYPEACLMNMVDDAKGETMGLMAEEETTQAAMRLLRKWIETYGIPVALYTDHKNVFVTDREPTLEEQLAGKEPRTAFGLACEKLGIQIIVANSPQAKGRVERSHGVYQDRFQKELRLRRITTINAANKLLENGFTQALNAKFARTPACPKDAHRPVPKTINLDDVFAFEDHRVLTNDWTIRHHNRYYQLLDTSRPLPRPKDKILVRTRLNGEIVLEYKGKAMQFRKLNKRELAATVAARSPKPPRPNNPKPNSRRQKNNSPWRQGCIYMRADTTPPLRP